MKSASRPGDKPRMNRLSTAGFVPPPVYIGIPLFVIAQNIQWTCFGWEDRSAKNAVVEFVEWNRMKPIRNGCINRRNCAPNHCLWTPLREECAPGIIVQDAGAQFSAFACNFSVRRQNKEGQTYRPDTKFMSKGYTAGQLIFPHEGKIKNPQLLPGCQIKAQRLSGRTTDSRTCLAWKGFTETNGGVTLVSSQERRALAVPLTNRLSSADEPVVNRGFCSSVGSPGHALHEKGLQRQIGDGTLVSTQERRALFVPLINRG